ncbi:hypothetical protein [Virgibacillus salexigens]|uniref:Uncharacterized protein n=1 Tax=Virgibacillus massiliensis TaxID=1462526 RepID=A0A024QHG1_9BACI|nr:hypothetical protein [Virgibacillus massiliensis]CDQ41929.1 hypothetical protein BN990_04308 [Virgibacillus massiliensis]
MSNYLHATLYFPLSKLDKEVNHLISKLNSGLIYKQLEHLDIVKVQDPYAINGEFLDLEYLLVKKDIPFDRYTEDIHPEDPEAITKIVFYRSESSYTSFEVLTNKVPSVSTKELYDLMKSYANKRITNGDLLIRISELIESNDPLLVSKIKPLVDYKKEDIDHGELE